jgi:exodeoxyribonuclease V alpha subunit
MPLVTSAPARDAPPEHLAGSVERVTFHSEDTGFCVLRVKVRGHRDLVTVVGTAPTITPGEYIEGQGSWVTDRTHGLQFKTTQLPAFSAKYPPAHVRERGRKSSPGAGLRGSEGG